MIKQLLDKEALNIYFDNDYGIALSVLKIFIDEVLPETYSLLSAEGEQDVMQIVHKIKPSYKMIGLRSFAGALESIEQNCDKGNYVKVKGMIGDFMSELNSVRPQILDEFTHLSKLYK